MQHWTVHEKVEFPKFPADTGGGSIPQLLQLLILNSELKLTNFPMLDGGGVYSTPFATFDSELRKWKIYIDIFYRVSCNIKHITAIWNLYFQ